MPCEFHDLCCSVCPTRDLERQSSQQFVFSTSDVQALEGAICNIMKTPGEEDHVRQEVGNMMTTNALAAI